MSGDGPGNLPLVTSRFAAHATTCIEQDYDPARPVIWNNGKNLDGFASKFGLEICGGETEYGATSRIHDGHRNDTPQARLVLCGSWKR